MYIGYGNQIRFCFEGRFAKLEEEIGTDSQKMVSGEAKQD
jgi:hypothetical protein